NDDNQDVSGKKCWGFKIRHDCATGVKQLLVSGDHDTDSRLFLYKLALLQGYAGYIANHPKGNGVGREKRTVRRNTMPISYIRTV
ncbi:hypothetical protein ACIKK6_18110, partial [Bacillus thuringiensis]